MLFTSPVANGRTNYSAIAFETDLPRIEAADSQDNPPFCDRTTGANRVNPPNGARLPVLHDRGARPHLHLATGRPEQGFTTVALYNNFNSGDRPNPCPVR
ncbi:MAG: hypothetical protein WBP81_14005 [Solirubrobacteraceae bacterium]